MDTAKFYNENNDFKEYVDRFCRTNGYTVEEALKHKIVNDVADYYASQPRKEKP